MNLENVLVLQNAIIEEVRKENGHNVNFVNKEESDGFTVKVFTLNTKNKEFFLLMSTTAKTQEEALEMILQYVKTHKTEHNPYTVKWVKKGESQMHESHFYVKDVIELTEKFFTDKDRAMYVIHEIKLNPIA